MAWSYVYTDGYPSIDTTNNAQLMYNYLTGQGVTPEATCAIIGNMQYESGLNTGQWEHHKQGEPSNVDNWSVGFGLGQWTPASKYRDYLSNQSITIDTANLCNGDYQLAFLIATPSQWSTKFLTPSGVSTYYNLTGVPYFADFSSFLASTYNVQDLATAYMVCWERPDSKVQRLEQRKQYAQHWYDTLYGGTPSTGHSINVSTEGSGTVTQSAYRADAGTQVTLTATPTAGESFINWTLQSGDIVITDAGANPLVFTMGSVDEYLMAHFTGDTPPIPPSPPAPTTKRKHMPIWMYPYMRAKGI